MQLIRAAHKAKPKPEVMEEPRHWPAAAEEALYLYM